MEKCVNVKADPTWRDGRQSICPQCGGYLTVLDSGFFRAHKPVHRPGSKGRAEMLHKLATGDKTPRG